MKAINRKGRKDFSQRSQRAFGLDDNFVSFAPTLRTLRLMDFNF